MTAHGSFFDEFFAPSGTTLVVPDGRRGGARPNSGPKKRKPPEQEVLDPEDDDDAVLGPDGIEQYDRARRRRESALADKEAALALKAALDYEVQSGNYVPRAQVVQASATAFATIAQALRSISDNLERKGIAPEVAEMVGIEIDIALDDLADALERLNRISDAG